MTIWKAPTTGETIGEPNYGGIAAVKGAGGDPATIRQAAADLRAARDRARRALIDAFEAQEASSAAEARLRANVRGTSSRRVRTMGVNS